MNVPPRWTDAELEAARQVAIAAFRHERIDEPLEDYLDFFETYQGHVETLLELTVDLTRFDADSLNILTDDDLRYVFRYLAGPPISEDDLKVLADTNTLSNKALSADPELVRSLIGVVIQAHDRRRFPWVTEERDPTPAERDAAVLASAAMIAMRKQETKRRNEGKTDQEEVVRQALLHQAKMVQVDTRSVGNVSHAPAPGEFCAESMLGTRKADFVVRLWDGRLMAVECKVSNSSTNSIKRLNNDAAVKAGIWIHEFGFNNVVPTAVLSGVYKLGNLQNAQTRGLTLFWAHDLAGLIQWIDGTRPSAKTGG